MANLRTIKSYGRTVAKTLSDKQKSDLDEYLESNSILDFQNKYNEFILEIGFGNGENIEKLSCENPNIGIIGVEPFKNSCVKTIRQIRENSINNILIINDDVKNLYSSFADKFFNKTYILFPDPWPKKKHNKRRLINEDFFVFLLNKTKQEIVFATDDEDYFQNVLEIAGKYSKINIIENGDSLIANTRYQQKAVSAGRKCNYVVFSDFK